MKQVNLNDAVVGSIIVEPVIKNGVLLCKAGVPLSVTLKDVLMKFKVEVIKIDDIFSESIDSIATDFKKLNRLTIGVIQSLSMDDIVLCAKNLVTNMVDTDCPELIESLMNYDVGTYNHSKNVAALSLSIGLRLGLSKSELRTLTLGALLHDIGKKVIPISIINKNGKLSDEEYTLIKQHPLIGSEMIKSSGLVSEPVTQIILQHHENWDGSGYPRELNHTNSYRLARLVHICDVYDALCARRSYKMPISRISVRNTMMENKGIMFDPTLLDKFMKSIPVYFIGEEVVLGDYKGVIVSNDDVNNPSLLYKDKVITLSAFESLANAKLDAIDLKLID